MRLLFDESVPYRLRQALPNHAIRTVVEMGWGGTKNGELLLLAGASFVREPSAKALATRSTLRSVR